jgi:two-component system, NarL family, response regulator NreC
MKATTVFLADDHTVVRQGLRSLLETEAGLSIVGEAGDGLEAVRLVEKLQPNVLVVDMMMPGLNGIEVTRQVSKRVPVTRVILLSMHATEAYVLEALKAGAQGYVLKGSDAADLLTAITEVMAGRRYLSGPLSDRAMEAYIEKARETVIDPYETLTAREREVLQLVAESHSNPEMAALLSISPRTAETHRAHVMHKLGLQNQTDVIRYCLQRGIIALDP